MPISISRYVDVTSSIGAANNVSVRNLNGLILNGNVLTPSNTVLTFTSAAAVGTYYGTSSEEYNRAVFYFGWISKQGTQPNQLNFYYWNNDVATGSKIFGATGTYALSTFTSITNGSLDITLGGVTETLTGINLSSAASLSAVATDIQTAIQAYTPGGSAWTAATVTYDATFNRFKLVSGTTGADTVSCVAAASGTDLASPLGWLASEGAIFSNGTAAQTITQCLTSLQSLTNNFGSFCFTDVLAPNLTTIEAAATWNNALNPNNQFLFSVQVTPSNASTWSAALATTGGVTLTLQSPGSAATTEFPEMAPMMLLGATDYTQPNAAQNYMYQSFNLTPSVTTDTNANVYDPLLVNYYGNTQTAGQFLSFYQRGVMFGLPTQPSDQNVYANEIWFKDALTAAIMTALLSLTEIPASNLGKSILLNVMQPVITQAVINGTIEPGKQLTQTQILYITQQTGSPKAWQQVQNLGYWVNAVVEPYVVNGITEYKAVYTLIYSKNDVIRLVQGSDILI